MLMLRAEMQRCDAGQCSAAGKRERDAPTTPAADQRDVERVLALQRSLGNAGVARLLTGGASRRSGAAGSLIQRVNGEFEWISPGTGDAPQYLGRARAATAGVAKAAGQPEIATGTYYWIVTDRLYLFGPGGNRLGSFGIRPGATTLPAGTYLSDASTGGMWWRYGRPLNPEGPRRFYPFAIEDAKRAKEAQLSAWLEEGAFEKARALVTGADSNLMVIGEAAPGGGGGGGEGDAPAAWATKTAGKAQELLAAKRAAAGGGGPRTGPVTDPEQRKLPDRIVLLRSVGGRDYVHVWADAAHKLLELVEGETADELLARASAAALELREERDPARSQRVAGGVEETGLEPGTAGGLPRDPDRPPTYGTRHANAPPYPATVVMSGIEPTKPEEHITVLGATNNFAMQLDFTPAGMGLLSQVTARMQPIEYYWELIKVTSGDYAKQLGQARSVAAGGGEAQSPGSGEAADIARAWRNVEEDTRADVKDMEKIPWGLRSQYLQVIGLSVAVRSLGSVVSAFTSVLSLPRNERRIGFDDEGDYVVRCIATPMVEEDAAIARASSIAARPVRVTSVRQRAQEVAGDVERRIAELESQLKLPPPGKTAEEVKAELEELRAQQRGSHADNTARRLEQFRKGRELAEQLKRDEASATPREQRSDEVRWLTVRLAVDRLTVEAYLANVGRVIGELEELQKRLAGYGARGALEGRTYSPRVTLASEEDGRTYQLMCVLAQTKARAGQKVVEYRLADVTSKGSQQEYFGRSMAEGRPGHHEAIRNAFLQFAENNGYGRGTIVIRLPADLEANDEVGPVPMERELRSAPGARERALQKLKDIATAAEIAGMVVGGPAGLAIGIAGGAAGALLAAENMRKRAAGDRLELDWETFMDVIGIVGGLAGGVGGAVGLARAAGSGARWAVTGERVFIAFAKGQIAGQVLVLPIGYGIAIDKIDKELAAIPKDARPNEGEIRLRKAEAFAQFAWGAFTTTVSAAQLMGMPAPIGEAAPADQPARPTKPGEAQPVKPVEPVRPVEPPRVSEPTPHEPVPRAGEPPVSGEPVPAETRPAAGAEGKAGEPEAARLPAAEVRPDAVVAEHSLVNAHGEPHEVHRTRDGSIWRCTGVCQLILDNVSGRARAVIDAVESVAAIDEKGQKIKAQAEKLVAEARKIVGDTEQLTAESAAVAAEDQQRQGQIAGAKSEAQRARLEASRRKWLDERNRILTGKADRIEQRMSNLETRARVAPKGDAQPPPAVTPEHLGKNFKDLFDADPALKTEMDEIMALAAEGGKADVVAARTTALQGRLSTLAEAQVPKLVEQARAAQGSAGVGLVGPLGGCVAETAGGTRTVSGWAPAKGYVAATDKVMELGQQIGHSFARSAFDDVPGHTYASHAEKQAAAAAPGEPIGVSLPMCFDCYAFFKSLAQAKSRPMVVADPVVTRVFYPDGRVAVAARAPKAAAPAVK